MDKAQLGKFAAMAECSSMEEVERKLGLPRPESSKVLMSLEAELGVPLMNHDHDGLELTRYGEILLKESTHMIVDFTHLEDAINKEKKRQENKVRFGMFATTHSFIVMGQLACKFPNLNFVVSVCAAKEVINDLVKNRLDIAVVPQTTVVDGLETLPLVEEQAFLSVPYTSSLVTKDSVTLADVAGEPMSMVSDIYGLSQWYEAIYDKAGGDTARLQKVESSEFLRNMDEATRSNFSSTVMQLFGNAAANRREIPIDDPCALRQIVVAYKPENAERLKPLIDFFKENRKSLYTEIAFRPYLMNPCGFDNVESVIDE